jgi:urea transport system permease protein
MSTFVEIVAQGLGLGAIYLLSALGLSIIYGVMGVINLAHGEFIMLGAYAMVLLAGPLSPWVAIVLSFFVLAAVGFVADFALIRFLYHKPVASMLGTWGLAMVIRQGVIIVLGADLRYVGLPLVGSFALGFGVTYSEWRAVLIGAALVVAALVGLVITRTDFGLKMRAVIGNPDVAASNGLRVERVDRMAFALGAGLAGLAGALVAPLRTVFPGMGLPFLVGSFLVVILAGLGNIRATVLWSALIGIGTTAVAIPVNDIIANIAIWAAALIIIAFRREALVAARV